MATATKKPAKKAAKQEDWSQAAAKTEVPEIVVSDEFHVALHENKSLTDENSRRIVIGVALAIGLAVLGVLWLWLTHESV